MKLSLQKAFLFVTVSCMLFSASVTSASINFSDFSSASSSLTMNGQAGIAGTSDGQVLRLTAADDYQHGSAFSTASINAIAFSTSFAFRLSDAGGYDGLNDGTSTGGDGFVFVLQNAGPSSIGGTGGTLAYEGMWPSVGVEFDTWRNTYDGTDIWYDPDSNHLGINANGSVISNETVNIAPQFDNGNIWYAWIDYDGTSLQVRANETGLRPELPQLSYDLNIQEILGSQTAYVGFTAATGGAWENQDIVSWQYLDTYNPIGNAIPEPSVLLLFGIALLALAGTNRLLTM